jgi:glycosyltransferase 2 family protein
MRAVLELLAREQLRYFAAAVGIYVATQVVMAYRWQLLAATLQLRGSFVDFLTLRFIATFTNTLVPGVFGGDVVRGAYLARRSERFGDAAASVIADRLLGFIGLVWVAAFGALFLNRSKVPTTVSGPPIWLALITLTMIITRRLIIRLMRIMPPFVVRFTGAMVTYLRRPGPLFGGLMLSVIVQIGLTACQFILAIGFGLKAPLVMFLFCVPIAGIFASLPLTINGLGVRESAYLVLFGMNGMRRSDAITLGLLWFASSTLGAFPGMIALALTPWRDQRNERAREIAARIANMK